MNYAGKNFANHAQEGDPAFAAYIGNATLSMAVGDYRAYDLTAYSRTGGCSCKIGADALGDICGGEALARTRTAQHASDDAAIIVLSKRRVLLSSIDFQNPLVGDSYVAGQIAAQHSVSDIYACGGKPDSADIVLAVPNADAAEQVAVGRALVEGIAMACGEMKVAITGGHTIMLDTPIVGLAVRGFAAPGQVKRKSGAHPGDILVLTKTIGVGTLVAAHQVGAVSEAHWASAMESLLTPNTAGQHLGRFRGVTAMTDVTGFGLAGHALEIARASGVTIEIAFDQLPLLNGALRAAASGYTPTLTAANEAFAGSALRVAGALTKAEKDLLFDPQTNGGLLISCRPSSLEKVLQTCRDVGQVATIVGHVMAAGTHPLIIRKDR